MSFSFTEEQEEFRGVVRRFLEGKSPTTEVRRLMETEAGYDDAVWAQMCGELGLTAIAIPEAYGGAGFGFVELGIVLEEMGRSLLCAPYFSSAVLAANAVVNAGDEAQKQAVLPGLAEGRLRATLAFVERGHGWDVDEVTMVADSDSHGFRLSGAKTLVLDGTSADLIVVVARLAGSDGEDGLTFFTVAGDAAGLTRRPLSTIDATRKLARLHFDRVAATPLGEPGQGGAAFRKTMLQAAVALANESVGGAQALFDSAVNYVQMRMQFGRPIGSFQAIKHRCADLLLALELAKSGAYYAAAAVDEDDDDLPALASLAKAAASETYMDLAAGTIQLHGGIGFTWENDTHLWFKRAKSSEVFLGDPTYHRERLMQRWGV